MIAKKRFSVEIIIICLLVFVPGTVGAAENLIQNGGMELGEGNPANWGMWGWQMTNARFRLDTGGAHQGSRFATIVNNENNDARFIQEVLVEEGKIYRISGWIKTVNVGQVPDVKGASICLLENSLYSTQDIKGTNGKWEYVEFYLEIGSYVLKVTVSLAVGGSRKLNTGQASFDDVRMEEVSSVPSGVIHAKIEGNPEDLPATPPPLNPGGGAEEPVPASAPSGGNPFLIVIVILALVLIAVLIVIFFSPKEEKSRSEQDPEPDSGDEESG